jgi:hypothetical protein
MNYSTTHTRDCEKSWDARFAYERKKKNCVTGELFIQGMTCSGVWHVKQDSGSLCGILDFREVLSECCRFRNLLDMGVIESNRFSEYPHEGNIMALMVPWITQVGNHRNQLIMGRGRWTKSIMSHIKYDGRCYGTAVFFNVVTVPDIATSVYKEKPLLLR